LIDVNGTFSTIRLYRTFKERNKDGGEENGGGGKFGLPFFVVSRLIVRNFALATRKAHTNR